MPFLKATSFNVVKAILIVVIVLSIIGSVAQLVAALFALAYAQDIDNINDQSLIEFGAIIMLLMALICFTFELIALIGLLMESIAVLSIFAVIMSIATIISCFTGSGGLKFLIILLNLTMTALTCVFIYLCIRKKEVEEFRQRNSMSISVINNISDDMLKDSIDDRMSQ